MRWLRRVLGGVGRNDGSALPEQAADLLAARTAWWATLDTAEQQQVLGVAEHLITRKRWEAAQGFELTDDVRLLVAAHAARLVIGLDDAGHGDGDDRSVEAAIEAYDDVGSIIVHRSTVRLRSEPRWSGRSGGIVRGGPLNLDGQAHQQGPVVISWGAAQREIRRPGRGYNVIYHEFAHKLDMVTPIIDGTPHIVDDVQRQRWVDVCTAEFERVKRGEDGPLRSYAATNPAEFFAVATEVFFDRPLALADERSELYDVLRDFYGQDPAARQRWFDERASAAADAAVSSSAADDQSPFAGSTSTTCDSATGR